MCLHIRVHHVAFLNSIALNWKSKSRACWNKASLRRAAPAVHVEKKSGTYENVLATPGALPDEVHGQMAGVTIFSTLDLQSEY